MKNKFAISLILFFVVIELSGCVRPLLIATPSSTPMDELLEEWLNHPICSPPCFENVIPGTSTIQEAYEYLKASKVVKPVEEPVWYELMKKYEMKWKFGTSEGRIVSKDNSNIVRFITLELENGTKIQSLIEAFGPPSHIVMHKYWNGKCQGDMIFLNKGIEVFVYPYDKNGQCDISPDLVANQIFLVPASKEGVKEAMGQVDIPWDETTWKGYGIYSY